MPKGVLFGIGNEGGFNYGRKVLWAVAFRLRAICATDADDGKLEDSQKSKNRGEQSGGRDGSALWISRRIPKS